MPFCHLGIADLSAFRALADIFATFTNTAIILSRAHPDPFFGQAYISPFVLSTNLSKSLFT